MKQSLLSILDIGTSKIICLIASYNVSGNLRILGVGHQLSAGYKSGVITDMKLLENAVLATIDQAEQMAGLHIDQVAVNINGSHIISEHILSEINLGSHPIGGKETQKVVQSAISKLSLTKQELLHYFPISYGVDDAQGIQDPTGLFGKKLTVDMHVIKGSTTMMANIAQGITRCQLDVEDIIASPCAMTLSCLTPDEMQHGVLLIDMGAGTTSLAVCHGGKIIYTSVIPIGGMHLTSDLAYGLSSSNDYAERIKVLHGYAIPDRNRAMELIEIPAEDHEGALVHGEVISTLRGELDQYLCPRVEEMLDMVEKAIDDHDMRSMIRKSVVLTGGASQLLRMKEAVSERFLKPVRLAQSIYPQNLPNYVHGPSFSVACGMLQFMVQKRHTSEIQSQKTIQGTGVAKRVIQWIQANF